MTNEEINSSKGAKEYYASNWWKEFLYNRDAPVSCEVKDDSGESVTTKIFSGEKIQFKIHRVEECKVFEENPVQEYKFVCFMRSYCTDEEPLDHPSAFYRMLLITRFSPTNGRYCVTKMKVGGERLFKRSSTDTEYLYQFVEDATNDYLYDSNRTFEGMELLLKLHSVYQPGTTAVPIARARKAKDQKYELKGTKYFETKVDGGDKLYPAYKLKNDFIGIDTGEKFIAFKKAHLNVFVDSDGFHSDRADEKHPIDVVIGTKEGYKAFCEKYC